MADKSGSEKKALFSLKKKEEGKTPAKKKGAKKKRRNPIVFIKDTISELKKVTWPTKKELTTASIAVIVFIIAFSAITSLIDLGLSGLFDWLIKS